MEETKRETKKKRRARLDIIGIIMLAFVTYIVVNSVISRNAGMETVIIRRGLDEDKLDTTAYVFREQTVINAPESGYVFCEVREDERVKSGETVVSIYKNEINSEVNNEISLIEEKIKKLSEGEKLNDVFSNDKVRLEQDIADRIHSVARKNSAGSAEGIAGLSAEINSLIEKKRIISGEAEPKDTAAELSELKARRDALTREHGVDRTYVHSPKAGAFTSRIDGMEELLGIDKLAELSPAYIRELDKKKIAVKAEEYAEGGDPIGKIVNNYSWSAAALVDTEDISDINVGEELSIRFSGIEKEAARATVTRITGEENGKVVIVLTTNKYLNGIYSTSKAEMEIIKRSYEGYKIPSEGIRIKDGVKGVYVIRNDIARFIPIEILHSNDDISIVTEKKDAQRQLKLYDELIVRGRDIDEGREVR